MKRQLRSKLVLLVVSTVLSLGAVELFLRCFYPAPDYGTMLTIPQQSFFQHHPVLGWSGLPNVSGPFGGRDFRVNVSHDSLGYRNSDPPWVADKVNLLIVGDSFTWGWGVGDEDVVSTQLNQKNPRLHAYNLAAPGYGTDQEYLVVKGFLEEHPDTKYDGLVLVYFINDSEDVQEIVRYGYPKPRFSLQGDQLQLDGVPVPDTAQHDEEVQPLPRPLGGLHRFHLYNLLRERFKKAPPPPPPTTTPPPETPGPEERNKLGDQLVVRLMQEIQALCEEHGMFFQVVLLETDSPPRIAALGKELSSKQISNSIFQMKTLPRTNLWLDGHLSPYGHSLLAEHILEQLPLPR